MVANIFSCMATTAGLDTRSTLLSTNHLTWNWANVSEVTIILPLETKKAHITLASYSYLCQSTWQTLCFMCEKVTRSTMHQISTEIEGLLWELIRKAWVLFHGSFLEVGNNQRDQRSLYAVKQLGLFVLLSHSSTTTNWEEPKTRNIGCNGGY